MLPEVNLIHMNGQVYEPGLERFMSADPIVQEPEFSQSFNRYSYAINNPLSLTDADGYESVQQLEMETVIGHREPAIAPPSSSSGTVTGTGNTFDFGPWNLSYEANGLSFWENMAIRYNQFMRGEFYPIVRTGDGVGDRNHRGAGIDMVDNLWPYLDQ